MEILYAECGERYGRGVPDVLLHRTRWGGRQRGYAPKVAGIPFQDELRNVPDAHFLAAYVDVCLNADAPVANRSLNTFHCCVHVRDICPVHKAYLTASGQQVGGRLLVLYQCSTEKVPSGAWTIVSPSRTETKPSSVIRESIEMDIIKHDARTA